MLSTLVNFLFAFFIGIASGKKQCGGGAPMESIKTYLNATLDYEVADWICCNNHRYAEKKGYLASPEVDLFGRLDPNETTVFYDSVCGIPLLLLLVTERLKNSNKIISIMVGRVSHQ